MFGTCPSWLCRVVVSRCDIYRSTCVIWLCNDWMQADCVADRSRYMSYVCCLIWWCGGVLDFGWNFGFLVKVSFLKES